MHMNIMDQDKMKPMVNPWGWHSHWDPSSEL